MTDKTPKNKAENPVNTPATLAGTTDTARDSESKGKALPQANALKARFKAGSVPLQTDFADLIDLANIGRQAVGGAEGQSGPANGFTLSSEGRLELKPNAAKGIGVDKDGISLKSGNGIEVNSSGPNVKLAKGAQDNGGGGQGTDRFTSIGSAGGLALSSNGLSVDAGNGIQIDNKGVSIKLPSNSGLSADEVVGLKIITGNGIAVNSSGVNIKLAKGIQTNGGGGHGTNGTTLGSGGGLNVNNDGFSVDPGNGMQIDEKGVSIKLPSNSGLTADETNGLRVVSGPSNGGVHVRDNSLRLNQESWKIAVGSLHGAEFYAEDHGVVVFFCPSKNGSIAYVYGRRGKYISYLNNRIKLNSIAPDFIMRSSDDKGRYHIVNTLGWSSVKVSSGSIFECDVKEIVGDVAVATVKLKVANLP